MAISEVEKYKLKKLIKQLAKYKGRHTELVTYYVPAGYDLNLVNKHLSDEAGTATNIKGKQTRDNVIGALEKAIQELKLYKKTPDNGLMIFSGNVTEKEGQQNFNVWAIEPPMPLNQRLYKCDKEFELEALKNMVATDEIYGLVVLDLRDATFALLKGKAIQILRKTHSEVPGKMRAGGQSAPRFARIRDLAKKEHYKKIAEYMKEQFLMLEGLKGIIIGGPGTTINDFLNRDYITGDVKKKIIGTKDLSYTEEFGLQELLDKSTDLLAGESVADEKKLMGQFFKDLLKRLDMVSYGKDQTMKALNMGAVEKLLLSDALDDEIIEEFEEKAEMVGTEVVIISTDTREGVQLRDMGKIAALLRYPIGE